MAVKTMPSTLCASYFDNNQIRNEESFRTAAGGIKATGRNGNRLLLTVVFNNVKGAKRRALWAYAYSLDGLVNRANINWGNNLAYIRTGTGAATGTITASAGARTASLVGAQANQTPYLDVGDWISIGKEPKIVLAACNTDGSGNGTLEFGPELHDDYTTQTVEVAATSVVGSFALLDAQGLSAAPSADGWLSSQVRLIFEEDITSP